MDEVVSYICEKYHYGLDDFYRKSWKEGGLTLSQIYTLYDHSIKRQNEEYKFMAAINGVTLGEKKSGSETNSNACVPNDLTFQDPEVYKDMSDEEKDELTRRMKSGHMRSIQSSGFGK